MLTVIADALLMGRQKSRWDAPDHFKQASGRRSNIEIERETAERRHRAMRNVGMW
ncbi:hypothetical protein [Yoonia sp.]|uniref:hypothetical protein n=1 Tax=Yoonia sp. TaxID=2212373 RepID=UPI0023B6D006